MRGCSGELRPTPSQTRITVLACSPCVPRVDRAKATRDLKARPALERAGYSYRNRGSRDHSNWKVIAVDKYQFIAMMTVAAPIGLLILVFAYNVLTR
jgi:hypothetical protein